MINEIYTGTSNVELPVPNKQSFPLEFQDKSRLTYYASLFNTVEINSSFYKVPMAKTVAKWADNVPPDFKFTFKLWQDITHAKSCNYNPDEIERFIHIINHVGNKKGCLLVQFPPSFAFDKIVQLQSLVIDIRQADPEQKWKVAIEFRNRSWYQESVYELLAQYNLGMVIQDMPASATPLMESTTDFVYLRFHGPEGRYKGSYEDDFLYEYAQYIKEWQADDKTVYVYFNNTAGGAVQNLMTLNSFLNQAEL